MAERPDGTMTAEDCAELSRAISVVMEEADPISDKYVLEVSSPGIDRPLTRLKDYERWEGFVAKLELRHAVENQKRFRGVLAGVEGDDIAIDLDGEDDTALIPFSLIATGKLILTDELVTESLRRAKAAGKAPNTPEDQIDDNAQDEG
ncbi:MAG: ribosome maturation factor RimP, partial [Pseudomonadota bacterium]